MQQEIVQHVEEAVATNESGDKLITAEEAMQGMDITPEQMAQWQSLLFKASREYVKKQIRSVEYRKEKAKRRNKAKLQKASRKQNRK